MLSRFAHKMRIDAHQVVLFNSILFAPVLVPEAKAAQIWQGDLSTLPAEEIDLLYEQGILINHPAQDEAVERIVQESVNQMPDAINLLYLIPYGGCNLACRYCFIGKINNRTANSMAPETVDVALDKFVAHLTETGQKSGKVIFYGGEPTVSFDLVRHAVEKMRAGSIPIQCSLITNATLLTDEMIDFFKQNDINLGISIDGPKPITDLNRIFKSGQASVSDLVVKNIQKLKEKGVSFGLSVTVSDAVLDEPNFLEWVASVGVSEVNFNLLHYTEPNAQWRRYYRRASAFLFRAHRVLSPKGIRDDRVLRKIHAFQAGTLKYNDCNAVGAQQLTIAPDGGVSICHGYWNEPNGRENIGHIQTLSFADIFKSEPYRRWKQNLTVNKKTCLKCPAIYICGGGCPKQSADVFGNQQGIDRAFCIHTKHALKTLFKQFCQNEKI